MRIEPPDQDRHRRDARQANRSPRLNPAGTWAVGDPEDCPPTRVPEPGPLPSPAPLFAGRYEIIRELGRGGMGLVSQARDTRLPRDVAIKVPLHLREPDSLRRFFKEAEAAAKLDHPRICRILDLGEADGLPYIVLAYIEGPTLAAFVDHRRVEPIRAAKITRSVARTIQFAHDRGIIHRDLKPSNLMIGPRRELIVMDFGLARFEGDERNTLTGQIFGTLPYMSPEQVRGQAGAMGKGCDIYTLGVIFYELLTGRLPFRGSAWELPELIVRGEPVPPSSLHPDVDPAFDAIVLKAMAKKIGDRFDSMAEFAEAIAARIPGVGSLSDSGMKLGAEPVPAGPPAPFPLHLRLEPLRESVSPRATAWDGFVWGSIAAVALAGISLSLASKTSRPRDAKAGTVVEPSRTRESTRSASGGAAGPAPAEAEEGMPWEIEASPPPPSRRLPTMRPGGEIRPVRPSSRSSSGPSRTG